MFTKQELELIGQTLAQKRTWIIKHIDTVETNIKPDIERSLQGIEAVLQKITHELKQTKGDKSITNHYISEKTVSPFARRRLAGAKNYRPIKFGCCW